MQAFLYTTASRPWGRHAGWDLSANNSFLPRTSSAWSHLVSMPRRRATLTVCAMTADEVRSLEGNFSTSPDNDIRNKPGRDIPRFSEDSDEKYNDSSDNGDFDESLISSDMDEGSRLEKPPTRSPKPRFPSRSDNTNRLERPSRYPRSSRPSRPDRPGREGGSDAPEFKADPDAIYYTRCAKCTAAYEMDPELIGRGRKVCCEVCSSVWFQRPERFLILNKEQHKFIDYPIDKKDEIMAEAANAKRDYRSRRDRDSSDRRPGNGDNRDGRYPRRGRASFSVFLGNLSYEVTEEDLKELLKPEFGDLKVTVVKDNETGRSKGFAFCDVSSDDEIESVIQFADGREFRGRSISAKAGRKT